MLNSDGGAPNTSAGGAETTPLGPSSESPSSLTKATPGNDATNNKDNTQGTTSGPSLVGMINNLISSDLENIVGMAELPVLVVYAPVKIMISVYFLYRLLGWRYGGVSDCTS